MITTSAEFVPSWQEGYMKEYTVQVNWDDESERWGLESEDIPGLLLENGSLDALLEYARFAVTDFLKDHPQSARFERDTEGRIALVFKVEKHAKAYA
jgi:hypothetical protein